MRSTARSQQSISYIKVANRALYKLLTDTMKLVAHEGQLTLKLPAPIRTANSLFVPVYSHLCPHLEQRMGTDLPDRGCTYLDLEPGLSEHLGDFLGSLFRELDPRDIHTVSVLRS